MIHVCFGLYDKTGRYSKFTGTTMLSIFENINTPPRSVTIHILHDNTLTLDNREKFSYVAGQYNQLVKFYNVEELCVDKISEMVRLFPAVKTSRFSIASLYRLIIPQILSDDIEKAIYLDSDIIVNLDINELWRIELGDKVLGGVPEIFNGTNTQILTLCRDNIVKGEDYFNSGVLLINLKILRDKEDLIIDGVKFVGEHTQLTLFDQDTLNRIFSTNYLKLPVEFNYFVKSHRYSEETFSSGKIYHYTDSNSGIGIKLDTGDPFSRLWIKYFAKTPWFNEETIGRLYAGVQGLHVGLKNFAAQVSAMMSGKTRAFFILPNNVEAMKKIFSIRDDEEIILAENPESLQKLIDAMKLSAGKKVFFIVLPIFPFQVLIQEGFVPKKDFVNGMDFLSELHGVPLNSYPLVKAI